MADLNSNPKALRLVTGGLHGVVMDEPNATARQTTIPPAIMFKTQGHPLVRMDANWGVCFLGTKAELQAAGFGAGAVFPGEPGGNKKKTALPPCNGFAQIGVELYENRKFLGEPSQTALPNYVVDAHYLPRERKEIRIFEPSQWPGVELHHDTWCDVYRGSKNALIAANLAAPWQFPGQPGCGKGRTTFKRDGTRVTVGSNFESQEGNRTVLAAGKHFEVWIQVSEAEHDKRIERLFADSRARDSREIQEIAAMFMQHQAEPTRHHLRLVWSADSKRGLM